MLAHTEILTTERTPRVSGAASSERGGRYSECPNGASSFSPGSARQRRDYPGLTEQNPHNPEGVVSIRVQAKTATTPLGLLNPFDPITQGSFATLGWRPESRWDSQTVAGVSRFNDSTLLTI